MYSLFCFRITGERCPCSVHHAEQASLDDIPECFRRSLLERSEVSITCIVDQHIQPTKFIDSLLHGELSGLLIANIQFDGKDALSIVMDQRV